MATPPESMAWDELMRSCLTTALEKDELMRAIVAIDGATGRQGRLLMTDSFNNVQSEEAILGKMKEVYRPIIIRYNDLCFQSRQVERTLWDPFTNLKARLSGDTSNPSIEAQYMRRAYYLCRGVLSPQQDGLCWTFSYFCKFVEGGMTFFPTEMKRVLAHSNGMRYEPPADDGMDQLTLGLEGLSTD